MATLPPYRDPGSENTPSTGPATTRATWTWVVAVVAAVLLVILLVALHLSGVINPRGH